ncbi:unnamed protein product [Amoebophrya sp. A25]|nr:unnamed protein product [Amoebophrya sp. A25]|eukprot:GSA25T00026792001.1
MVIPAKKDQEKPKDAAKEESKSKTETKPEAILDEEDDFEEFKLPSSLLKASVFQRAMSKEHVDRANWDDEDQYDAFQETLKKEIAKVGK